MLIYRYLFQISVSLEFNTSFKLAKLNSRIGIVKLKMLLTIFIRLYNTNKIIYNTSFYTKYFENN